MADSRDQAAQLIRRLLFFVLLIFITLLNLLGTFRGLTSPYGMEQAQMGREIARGNFLETKMLRPRAIAMAEHDGGQVDLSSFQDTYHSPLHPIFLGAVLKAVGGDDFDKWKMDRNERIYGLDRVIACSATICFLLAILVNYVLISKIFDGRIAGVTALLLLLCNLLWNYTASGLPQMLMLLLFSLAMLCAYLAIDAQNQDRTGALYAFLAGVFLILLTLTHWLAIWILIAYIIYAAIVFQPRGIIGLGITIIACLSSLYFISRNVENTGIIFGNAFLSLHNGLAGGSEDVVMRTFNLEDAPLELKGLIRRIANTGLLQLTDLYKFLGAIFAAPIFFLSLLHPFRKPTIASFRWLVFALWVAAAIGMAIYGLHDSITSSNQLHLLFIPLMTGYGLAFLSIIWVKLDLGEKNPLLKHAHLIVVVLISAGPLLLSLPDKIRLGAANGLLGFPNWPPYWPTVINYNLTNLPEDEIIVTDQPWSTAWYGDRHALWLPRSLGDFDKIEEIANDQGTPFAGFYITPISNSQISTVQALGRYGVFTSMVVDGVTFATMRPSKFSVYENDPKLFSISKRFNQRSNLFGGMMYFYGKDALTSAQVE